MNNDISRILRDWKYDPDNTIRIIKAENGRELIQVRLPLGIEQYELEGRPDGIKQFGKESVLDEYEERIKNSAKNGPGRGRYKLDRDDFQMIQNEGILYYYRYLLLFQTGDYERCIRDTAHNLRFCDIVEEYGADQNDKNQILQYKPYILRINAISRAMNFLYEDDKAGALEVLNNAVQAIQKMPDIDTSVFTFERIRSVKQILSVQKQVLEHKENPVAKLMEKLKNAVSEENYELAASIRDEINELTRTDPD